MNFTKERVQTARQVAVSLMPHVNAVLMARAHAQLMREKISAMHAEVLDYLDVRDDAGQRITDPTKAWHMDDRYSKEVYAEYDKRNREAGYKLKPGHCPALIAEGLQVTAEHNLVIAASEFFPEVTIDRLLCAGLDKYRKFIDLTIRLAVNAPGYKQPKI